MLGPPPLRVNPNRTVADTPRRGRTVRRKEYPAYTAPAPESHPENGETCPRRGIHRIGTPRPPKRDHPSHPQGPGGSVIGRRPVRRARDRTCNQDAGLSAMNTSTPKTIFITGATGLVGSHAAEEALRRGHRVRALVRASSDTQWLD